MAIYNITSYFLEYTLIHSTKTFLHGIVEQNRPHMGEINYHTIPSSLKLVLQNRKDAKKHTTCKAYVVQKAHTRYAQLGYNTNPREWKICASLPFNISRDSSLVFSVQTFK